MLKNKQSLCTLSKVVEIYKRLHLSSWKPNTQQQEPNSDPSTNLQVGKVFFLLFFFFCMPFVCFSFPWRFQYTSISQWRISSLHLNLKGWFRDWFGKNDTESTPGRSRVWRKQQIARRSIETGERRYAALHFGVNLIFEMLHDNIAWKSHWPSHSRAYMSERKLDNIKISLLRIILRVFIYFILCRCCEVRRLSN